MRWNNRATDRGKNRDICTGNESTCMQVRDLVLATVVYYRYRSPSKRLVVHRTKVIPSNAHHHHHQMSGHVQHTINCVRSYYSKETLFGLIHVYHVDLQQLSKSAINCNTNPMNNNNIMGRCRAKIFRITRWWIRKSTVCMIEIVYTLYGCVHMFWDHLWLFISSSKIRETMIKCARV